VLLRATGVLAADSGKSIFLENRFSQQRVAKTCRWEIPYQCIVELSENTEWVGSAAQVHELQAT
jgi:hypothetical protein